jgi:hypothetical protein
MTRAARAVAVTGTMNLALDNYTVTGIIAVMTVDEESQKGSKEEEDDVPVRLLVMYY